ncbi:MAG TPA: hypothetical protein VF756_17075 [Thermoanaerobaculia bacterium]
MTDQHLIIEEELRELAWEGRINIDRMLKLADAMPPGEDRERFLQAAETLKAFCAQLRHIAASLPVDEEDIPPEKITLALARLRPQLERAVRDYLAIAIQELREIAETPS